jgi:hypothetical protein
VKREEFLSFDPLFGIIPYITMSWSVRRMNLTLDTRGSKTTQAKTRERSFSSIVYPSLAIPSLYYRCSFRLQASGNPRTQLIRTFQEEDLLAVLKVYCIVIASSVTSFPWQTLSRIDKRYFRRSSIVL